ncbi:hypothetical protein K458DRAFT_486331, partial [Lentithecium fluviatile CBS 122367]
MSGQSLPSLPQPRSPLGPPVPQGPFIDTRAKPLPSRAILLVAPVTSFYILALICIGLRIWSKRLKKNSLRFSDYAIFVAAIFATGYLSICWIAVERGGVGYPLLQIRPSQRIITQQSFVAAWLIQTWANSFVRLSILDFFSDVFRVSKFRVVVHVCEALAIAYLVGCTITFFAICRPIKYNWELGPPEACGDRNLKFLLSAIFNLTLDVCILVLPMPMLWRLQMSMRKKAAVTVVFGLGIFVCFATAWRIHSVIEFSKPASKMNFTVTVVEDALWSGLEINLGIINACMPIMPPALQKIFKVPFTKLLSLTTWRSSSKPSKMSSGGRSDTTGGSGPFNRDPSWRRLNESNKSKSGILQEHTIDIEAESMDSIPMGPMGADAWGSETPKR